MNGQRQLQARICLCSDFVGKCIGEDAKYEGVRLLFDGLQQPVLNKQVDTLTNTHANSSANRVVTSY